MQYMELKGSPTTLMDPYIDGAGEAGATTCVLLGLAKDDGRHAIPVFLCEHKVGHI